MRLVFRLSGAPCISRIRPCSREPAGLHLGQVRALMADRHDARPASPRRRAQQPPVSPPRGRTASASEAVAAAYPWVAADPGLAPWLPEIAARDARQEGGTLFGQLALRRLLAAPCLRLALAPGSLGQPAALAMLVFISGLFSTQADCPCRGGSGAGRGRGCTRRRCGAATRRRRSRARGTRGSPLSGMGRCCSRDGCVCGW